MLAALRFWFRATRGHLLQPWRSPYLRWRIETFSGVKADDVDRKIFFRFLWQQRHQLIHFLRWTSEMRGYASNRELR